MKIKDLQRLLEEGKVQEAADTILVLTIREI